MTVQPPGIPFFVKPPSDENGGVDFLGLRQANLNLMDDFLPGINNVTRFLRPYSMMCWTVWAFRREAEALGLREVKASQFQQFREKTEILFGWGHQLNDSGTGLAGNAQACPTGTTEVPLDFASWKRKVSWFDAVNYGPSLKDENGLGFVHQIGTGFFALTQSGVALAESLDAKLKRLSVYPRLASLSDTTATSEMADELYAAWSVYSPSSKEASVFRPILYNTEAIGSETRTGRRSSSIALILSVLEISKRPMTTGQLRKLMTGLASVADENTDLREPHSIWKVLQVRQAQRLAFEVLFGWVEDRVLLQGDVASSQMVAALIGLLEQYGQNIGQSSWIANVLSGYASLGKAAGSILEMGIHDPSLDIFEQCELLQDCIPDRRDEAAVRAIGLLLLVAAITSELDVENGCRILLNEGGSRRVSLSYWARFVREKQHLPVRPFLTSLIENFLLSQHFGVAAIRTTESKPRLRLTIEEEGLVSLLKGGNDIWHPALTLDRLASVLSLMADCGLLERQWSDIENEWMYTLTTIS